MKGFVVFVLVLFCLGLLSQTEGRVSKLMSII